MTVPQRWLLLELGVVLAAMNSLFYLAIDRLPLATVGVPATRPDRAGVAARQARRKRADPRGDSSASPRRSGPGPGSHPDRRRDGPTGGPISPALRRRVHLARRSTWPVGSRYRRANDPLPTDLMLRAFGQTNGGVRLRDADYRQAPLLATCIPAITGTERSGVCIKAGQRKEFPRPPQAKT
jgi:hypothetical protein